MDKKASFWERIRPSKRRLIQLYAALLFNANVKGYIEGEIYTGKSKYLCVPGINCYSCPGAIGACPLGALQNALASTGNRAPWYVFGILTLFGITLGRTICGFLCPFGLIQELFHKIPTPKLKKNAVTRVLSWVKYVLLAVLVFIVPLWYAIQKYPVPAFCKYICPAGTLEGAIGLLSNPVNAEKFSMLNILFTRKFIILVLIITACIFLYRAFCRFLCPLGALYGLFAKFNIVGVKVNESKCTHCGRCVGHCKMDIRHVGDHECIHCGGCIDVCPTSAISLKAGKITLQASAIEEAPHAEKLKKNRRIAWGAALVFLAVVLIVANVPTTAAAPINSSPVSSNPADNLTVGADVGNLAADFTIPVYGGEDFTLSQHKGQVVVLNFWATWCTPCVAELPYFQQLHETYPDIAVLAIHSDLITDDVEEYLAAQPYTMPFAQDDGSVIASFNGSTMLPQTVVIDQDGIIVYNQVGSVTYELLDSLVSPLVGGAGNNEAPDSAGPVVGAAVGDTAADFTIPVYGGEDFTLSQHRGQVVVLNFWATWCTPCVAELPYFQQLHENYPDIALLAIHSDLITDDVEEYLAAQPYTMPFGQDDGSVIAGLDGSTMLPQTVVIDQNGIIVYNKVGSVTYELLESLVQPLLAQ